MHRLHGAFRASLKAGFFVLAFTLLAARMRVSAHQDAKAVSSPGSASALESSYDDDFDVDDLDPKWSWIRGDSSFWGLSAIPGKMTIMTREQDIWRGSNDAMLLVQEIQPSDQNAFTLQTGVEMVPTANYHQAGLLIYQNDDNYVRLSFGWINGLALELGREVNGSFSGKRADAPANTSLVHLRLVKSGSDYSAYYSLDGEDWVFVDSYGGVNITPVKFGLYAFNAKHATPVQIPAMFDYFKVNPYDDDFTSTVLQPNWSWIRGDSSYWSLAANPGHMTITTRGQDIWQGNNDAMLLVQDILASQQNEYTIQTKIAISPTANFHQAGLLIYQDDDNYVRVSFAWINGLFFEFSREEGGVFSPVPMAAPPGTSAMHLRLEKTGPDYYAYYSLNGDDWFLIGYHIGVNIAPTKFGLYAFNAKHATTVQIPAAFDYFKVFTYPPPTAARQNGSGTCWQTGASWPSYFVDYSFAPDLPQEFQDEIHAAANTWNDVEPSHFTFFYRPGSRNVISLEPIAGDFPAVTSLNYNIHATPIEIVEARMVFNSNYNWSFVTPLPADGWSVETLALHEFGHFLQAHDIIDPACQDQVMYKLFEAGEYRVTLGVHDIEAINYQYP